MRIDMFLIRAHTWARRIVVAPSSGSRDHSQHRSHGEARQGRDGSARSAASMQEKREHREVSEGAGGEAPGCARLPGKPLWYRP